MDNITHTLVGAALAEAGLKKRTPLAAVTLMIGANFPDIDVIAVPLGGSIEWRRGVTHGFLALVILPVVLAWLVRLYDRKVRLRRHPDAVPADFGQLTLLSAVAILTHPVLDFMNTYGMRWLMPFVNRWFYADGLFIVDIWVLTALIVGVVWSRRARWVRPARISLGFLSAYTAVMLVVTGLGRRQVEASHPGVRFLVAPQPFVPWQRDVLVDQSGMYRFGRFSLLGGLEMSPATIEKGESLEAARVAREDRDAQIFLRWARFPFYRVVLEEGGTVVRIADARYASEGGESWASIQVRLP